MQIKAVIGLGNPGPQYQRTRHNIGFMVVDRLAQDRGLVFGRSRFHGEVTRWDVDDHRIWILKPGTYMNESGRSVESLSSYYQIQLEDILVVHDDLDLALGTLRFVRGGSSGGHNGLKSIIAHLGSQDFPRLKLGIAHPGDRTEVIDHVLSPFSVVQGEILDKVLSQANSAVQDWVFGGIGPAMNRNNGVTVN
jgi:PTH1 family peptidyl-tRNA hydrolase